MSAEPLQRSQQTKSYAPATPDSSVANPEGEVVATGSAASTTTVQKPPPMAASIAKVTKDDIILDHTFDANRKTKHHINIRIKDSKGVAQRFAGEFPAGYCRVMIKEAVEGKHGKNRQMAISWVSREMIAVMQKFYMMIFGKLIDFVLSERDNGITNDSAFVYDHGKGIEKATTYYDLVEEVAKLDDAINKALRKKQDVTELEDQLDAKQALLEDHRRSLEIKLWSMCDIKGVLSRPDKQAIDLKKVDDETPIRTKYVETTTYPDKKNPKITEEVFEQRKREGNINRIIFVGAKLAGDKIRFSTIRERFVGAVKDNRIPIKLMKSKKGNEYYGFHDLDMIAKLAYQGIPHMCKCGVDVILDRFQLSQDGKFIRLKEEFSKATLYDIVPQPPSLQFTRVDEREDESAREEEAAQTSGTMYDQHDDMDIGGAAGGDAASNYDDNASNTGGDGFNEKDFIDA